MAATKALLVVVLTALGASAAAVACVSSSSNPSPSGSSGGTSSSGGSEDSGGGSSSGSSSGATSSSSSGSSSGSGSGSSSGSNGCTYTLSGAVTANGTCTSAGAYSADNATTAWGITPGSTSPVFGFSAVLGSTPAAFQAGTYGPSNVLKADGEYTVINGTDVQAWVVQASDGGAQSGTFSLDIQSTGTEIVVDAGAVWPAHGNLSLTLEASGSDAGAVNATVNF